MTQEKILEYNRRCAEFLGWTKGVVGTTEVYYRAEKLKLREKPMPYSSNDLIFHSDWNWIMEVYDKIMRLPSLGDIEFQETGPLGIFTNIKYNIPNKEKTIKAINQFLIWYNENK